MYESAFAEFEKVLSVIKGAVPVEASIKLIMAHTLARWGKKDEALRLLEEVADMPKSAYSVAAVYAALGDNDKGFELLDQAYDERDMQLVSLRVDPTVDELRGDPRFAGIVERVGLPFDL
jgi:tetratricopeptide (TPR) repeat protein